ncbi:MAG TPA: hypothetical protein VH855_10755 [Acetobacteraceae bacterium]|jgi:hypothetical protein
MRKTMLTALAVLAIGGTATGIVIAQAQPAPPAPGREGPPSHGMGWMHHGHEWQERGGMMQRLRTFALVYPQQDRKLTPPDVQKIAEAFLLWHGNHDWKVIDVAPTPDGPIGFALATQDGSVIARFTMDPHSARVERVS